MSKPKKVKAETVDVTEIKLKPEEFGILFDLIKEGKSLQDVARALIPKSYAIVQTIVYDA
jgi:Asp-tRNA(Asn)/Glu-tRNA(Gln) amidotransferase B subunit